MITTHTLSHLLKKLKLAGESTYTEVGGFPALITALNQRTEASENVLKLHAGDAISGTLYYALFQRRSRRGNDESCLFLTHLHWVTMNLMMETLA
ncbi:hypothetical protein QW180_30375 [Vibrio sinaloensis]|nr:hypothetical protein [Vibrio sinaloensis]